MFNTQEYNDLIANIEKAHKDLEVVIKKLHDAEKHQRKVFFWGSLAFLLITCAATVFAYPRMTKFGVFICALVSCVAYLFFIISQHFTSERVEGAKNKVKTKEKEFKTR